MSEAQELRDAIPEVDAISDPAILDGVRRAWAAALERGGHRQLQDTRLLVDELSADVGIEHQRGTVRLAIAIAEVLIRLHRAEINRDHVIAGALLHDLGKAAIPSQNGVPSAYRPRHPFYGAHLVLEAGLPDAIAHIVSAHSLEGVYSPKSLECHVVSAADELSADGLLRSRLGRALTYYKRAVFLP